MSGQHLSARDLSPEFMRTTQPRSAPWGELPAKVISSVWQPFVYQAHLQLDKADRCVWRTGLSALRPNYIGWGDFLLHVTVVVLLVCVIFFFYATLIEGLIIKKQTNKNSEKTAQPTITTITS